MNTYKLFLFALIILLPFTACRYNDFPNIPPDLGDIVVKYSGPSLELKVNDKAANENASVSVVQGKDNTTTFILENIVPGSPQFLLSKSTSLFISDSTDSSHLAGESSDTIAGYKVRILGQVTDDVLTATVMLEEMEGEPTNTSVLYNNIYKGKIRIKLPHKPNPKISSQKVYIYKAMGNDTSSIKFGIKNFSYSGIYLGNITIDTVKVSKRGDNIYGFKALGRTLKFFLIDDVKVDAYGTIVGDNMTLSLAVTVGSVVADVFFDGKLE